MQLNIKKELAKLLKEKSTLIMNQEDAALAIDFVAELMDLYRVETEQTESYATVSIKEMKEAYKHIRELEDFVNEYHYDISAPTTD